MRSVLVVGAALTALLTAVAPGSAVAVTGPAVQASPSSPEPGGDVAVEGSGFAPVATTDCELMAFGRAWGCRVNPKGAQGTIVLGDVPDVQPGEHTVQACVPTCADAWAGRASGTLVVLEGPGDPDRPGGSQEPQVSAEPSVSGEPGEPALPDRDVFGRPITPPPDQSGAPPDEDDTGGDVEGLVPQATAEPGPGAAPASSSGHQPTTTGTVVHGALLSGATVTTSRAVAAAPASLRLGALAAEGLRLSPREVSPDGRVQATAESLPTSAAGARCELTWDGAPAQGSCTADQDGSLRGTVRVPEDAGRGEHDVTACRPSCAEPAGARASTSVDVRAAGPGAGSPTAGAEPVVVPSLADLTADQARERLARADLRLGQLTGRGRVVGQDPEAGASVPEGTPVDVELRLVTTPPPPVEVPDLEGLTVEQAERALGEVTLDLVDPPSGDRPIAEQDPAAGTPVPPGSAVRVELAAATEPVSASASWPTMLLVLLITVATVVFGVVASALRVRWRAGHPQAPRLRPVPDLRPVVRTTVAVPAQRLPALQVLARPDDDPAVLLEVHR